MTKTLWLCLICSTLGCGRYTRRHAYKHYIETGHCLSLEVVTGRIWDYKEDEFIQRNDYIICSAVNLFTGYTGIDGNYYSFINEEGGQQNSYNNNNYNNNNSSILNFVTKKVTGIFYKYEVLLQTALLEQSDFFEMEIARIDSNLTTRLIEFENRNKLSVTEEEKVIELRKDIIKIDNECNDLGNSILTFQKNDLTLREIGERLSSEQTSIIHNVHQTRASTALESKRIEEEISDLQTQMEDLETFIRVQKKIEVEGGAKGGDVLFTTGGEEEKPKNGKKGKVKKGKK